MIKMEKLKVNDWVNYQGVKHQVAIVNGDGTVRLKSDDKSHPNYDNGTIGCFHESMFFSLKTAVEQLIDYIEEFTPKNKITDGIWSKAKSLLEMEKQQFINLHIECMKEGLIVEGNQRWEEKYLPKINSIAEKTWNKTYKSK